MRWSSPETNNQQTNPESRTLLPKPAFIGFASRYREPELSEGFSEIIKLDFEVCLMRGGFDLADHAVPEGCRDTRLTEMHV